MKNDRPHIQNSVCGNADVDAIHRSIDQQQDLWQRMALCFEHADAMLQVNPDLSLALADRGLALAKSFDDSMKIGKGYLYRGMAYAYLCQYPSAIRAYTAAEQAFRRAGNESAVGVALTNQALAYRRHSGNERALKILEQSLAIWEGLGAKRHLATALEVMAQIHSSQGHHRLSLELQLRVMELWKELGDTRHAGMTRALLASTYAELGDNRKALSYFEELLGESAEGAITDIVEPMLLANMGYLYCELGDVDTGLGYLHQALEGYNAIVDGGGQRGIVLSFLGRAYMMKGDADTALAYCNEALADVNNTGDADASLSVLQAAGDIHYRIGRYDEARGYLETILAMEAAEHCDAGLYRAHESLSKVLERTGDLRGALDHYRKGMEIKGSMQSREAQRDIAAMQYRLELEQAEKERRIALMKSARLEQEIEHKVKELAAMEVHLRERNQLLQKLKARITTGMDSAVRAADIMGEMLEELETEERALQSPQTFAAEIDRVQQEFRRTISQRFPMLTAAELRVCSLLRGNMSTKEIADLLNVTTRNVEAHRYHIRKKIGLPKQTSLTTFLASL